MQLRFGIFPAIMLLLSGCARFQHQTREAEPHAVVVIGVGAGRHDGAIVRRIDGLPVRPGREYRMTPGQHQLTLMVFEEIDQTTRMGVHLGAKHAGAPPGTLVVPDSGEPVLNDASPFPFRSTIRPLNVRTKGWLVSYTTNSVTVEAGCRYVLDGERTTKTRPLLAQTMREDEDAYLNARDPSGATALNHVALIGNAPFAKCLLEAGADADIADNEGFTPLHTAVEHRHQDVVAILLAHGADPNRATPDGRMPLHSAAANGDCESMHLLLKAGASLNVVSPAGTPLAWAAMRRETNAVLFLLKQGADLDRASVEKGLTALHHAAFRGYPEIVETLLEAGLSVNRLSSDFGTPLHAAASGRDGAQRWYAQVLEVMPPTLRGRTVGLVPGSHTNYVETLSILLAAGPNLDLRDPRHGRTALGWAVRQGCTTAVAALLGAGADVNTPNKYGYTPLHEAAEMEAPPAVLSNIVVRLIDAGANIEARDKFRGTPLHKASNHGQLVMAQLLVAAGADVNSRGPTGCTPLLFAIDRGDQALSGLLLDHGARFDIEGDSGATLLHTAARQGRLRMVDFLLARGIPIGARNKAGFTALHKAADGGHAEVVGELLRQGAQPDSIGRADATPLHLAANGCFADEERYVEVIEILLEHGATVNARSDNGRTPLHRAAVWGRRKILKTLLNAGADRAVRDDGGKTALNIANASYNPRLDRNVAAGRKVCAELLRQAAWPESTTKP